MLKHIEIDWAWLQDKLNLIIDTVNQQKVIGSATIAIEESPQGTLIKSLGAQDSLSKQATAPTDTPWKYTPDGETATWHKIMAFDPSTKNISTVWAWSGSLKLPANWWEVVTLVDPAANCAQSQASILVKPQS